MGTCRVLALLFLILFAASSSAEVVDAGAPLPKRPLTIAFAENYPPFSWRSKEQIPQGILRDFLEATLEKRLGIQVQYAIYPWARGQLLVQNGEVDGFFTIPTPKRGAYTEVSQQPLFVSNFYLYTGAENPNIALLRNLRTLDAVKRYPELRHVAIVGAGWHSTQLDGVKELEYVQDSMHILKLLRYNRADVYIEQRPLMSYQMKTLGYADNIIEIANTMDATHWHLMIGKTSAYIPVLARLDALLTQLEKRQELDALREQIFSRYR